MKNGRCLRMMNRYVSRGVSIFGMMVALVVCIPNSHAAEEVLLSVDCRKSPHEIHERVYGHFLEHIYHSCNGGLWGEVIWNRSFEDCSGVGKWSVEGDLLRQSDLATDCRLVLGADAWNSAEWENDAWNNYEYTFEAKKTGGSEGFLILFRTRHPKIFYWFNVGGWQNKYTQLEKSTLFSGKKAIGPQAPLTIEDNRWYRFRVRCEGATATLWCDDEKILEYTDPEAVITTGVVGLGTWNTTAEFRNIRVKSLAGEVLFEGLPQPQEKVDWRYWNRMQGKITAIWGDAANSDVAVRLESIRSETSMGIAHEGAVLAQQNIRVRQNDPLRGSIFARGKGELAIGLYDLKSNLNVAVDMVIDSADWREYPIAFVENLKDADAATLAIDYLDTNGNFVEIDQLSLMADSSRATGGYRPDLLAAIDGLKAPTIRWPGGCFASCYRWKSGIGPQKDRVRHTQNIWDDVDVNSFGTDEFLRMCEKLGIEPILVVNGGTWDKPRTPEKRDEYIREACEWIEYCNGSLDTEWGKRRAENGHPEPYDVRLWEMDNETWGSPMEVSEYCELLAELVPAVKKTDPSITILICGSGGLGERREGQDWNRYLLEHCASLGDYVSIHHYENPDQFADGPYTFEQYIETLKGLIASSSNPAMEIFVSEWNAQSTDWRTGLYAGGVLNAFERQGDKMTLGGPALFLRHVSANDWDNAFINFDQNGWFPAPNYVVMKLWREHYAPHFLTTEGDPKGLNISTAKNDANRIYVKVVNPSREAKSVSLTLTGMALQSATMRQVSPGSLEARNTLEATDAVHVESADVTVDGQVIRFMMPPLSAGVVTVEP